MKKYLNISIGRLVVLYLIITYVLYLFLPIKGMHTADLNEFLTVIFLLFVCIAFYLGCKSEPVIKAFVVKNQNLFHISNSMLNVLFLIVIIDLWLYLFDLISSGLAQLSLAMGENYKSLLASDELQKTSTWGRWFVLLSPLRVLLITYGVYNFKNISFLNRILLLLMTVSFVTIGFCRGQQVDFGTTIIYIFVPLFIYSLIKGREKYILSKLKWVLMAFVVFFTFSQILRAQALDYDLSENYEANSIIFKLFGEKFGSGISSLMMYFSHGYKGLNYSLQLPFDWTYGYGGSRALDQYLTQYLGVPSMYNHAYPMRVYDVFGYDCEMSWPTAFAWWASDFSFPGVVLLMFFLGKLICKVLRDSLYRQNIFAMAFLSQLTIMVAFMPLNNQILQARDMLIITLVLLFLWFVSNLKTRKKTLKAVNNE